LVAIILSSLKLVIDTYYSNSDPNSYTNPSDKRFVIILNNLDTTFTAIFTMEMTLKMISLGFIMDLNSYLSDTWSKLDFFIVTFSLLDLSL
jgi:hypothetical protein